MSQVYDEPIVVRLTVPVGPYPVGSEFGFDDLAQAIRALGSSSYFTVVRTQDGDPIPPPTPEDMTEAEKQALARARAARLIRGADFDPLWDRVEGIPDADELEQMRADVDAVADVPALVEAVTPEPGKEVIGGESGPVQRDILVERQTNTRTEFAAGENVVIKTDVNAIAPDVAMSTISGGGHVGRENVIGGEVSTVGSLTPNVIKAGTNASCAVIAGGYDNVVAALAGAIVGGAHHKVTGGHGTVSGGSYGEAGGEYSGVFAGTANKAMGRESVVVGGENNQATGVSAMVLGGENNVASGGFGNVVGGRANVASGGYATVIGGDESTASAKYATAMGSRAKAYTEGMVAHASGMFAAQGDAQAGRLTLRAVTTDGTFKVAATTGTGGVSHQMQHNAAMMYRMQVIARQAATNDAKGWTIQGVVHNPAGAPAAHVGGAPTPQVIAASAGAANWTCSISTGTDSFWLQVTGEADKTINWVALVEFVEVVV